MLSELLNQLSERCTLPKKAARCSGRKPELVSKKGDARQRTSPFLESLLFRFLVHHTSCLLTLNWTPMNLVGFSNIADHMQTLVSFMPPSSIVWRHYRYVVFGNVDPYLLMFKQQNEMHAPLETQHRPEKRVFDETDDALDLPTSLKKLRCGGSDSQAQSFTPLPTSSPPPSSPTSESHMLITRPIADPGDGVGKRGVGLRWRTDQEAARRSSLQINTAEVLADYATTAMQILSNKRGFVSSLRRALESMVGADLAVSTASTSSPPPKDSDSLGEIARHILECEDRGVGLDFEIMINLIRFILKLEYLQETSKEEHSIGVIRKEAEKSQGEFTVSQGKRWRDWGYRLAALAGAGM